MLVDSIGNRIYREEDNLYLLLQSEVVPRKLGEIDSYNKTLTTYREYDKHLFRKTNSFGFNSNLLETATLFNKIILNTDRDEAFVIPVSYILENGEYLFFRQQGFEKQIFIKLEQINKFKI